MTNEVLNTANIFTKRHEGEAVVYSHPDGGSVSARIKFVKPRVSVHLRYAVPYNGERAAIVPRYSWHRLTLFGDAKFLVFDKEQSGAQGMEDAQGING